MWRLLIVCIYAVVASVYHRKCTIHTEMLSCGLT